MTIQVNGRVYNRRAWTGGTVPAGLMLACIDQPGTVFTSILQAGFARELNAIRGVYYREQIGHWFDYWRDLPDSDTRNIFWRRATYDAYATLNGD